jgi:hypothetical protein
MNESQRDRIRPYYDAVKLFIDSGTWIGGSEGLTVMQEINGQLGNSPVCITCSAGVASLIKLTYNNYNASSI